MAPVVALEEADGTESIVAVTAQHRGAGSGLGFFAIKPNLTLIDEAGQDLNYWSSKGIGRT